MHFDRICFWKVDFLNTVEAKVIILTWYGKPNETMYTHVQWKSTTYTNDYIFLTT